MPTEGTSVTHVTDGLTPAAVVVPVVGAGADRSLVFTRRAPDLDAHPGQMSFPGGRMEPVDASLRETALRETNEEIGLPPTAVDIVDHLEPIETVTGFHVEAYVGHVPPGPFVPQHSEVAEVVVLPLSAFVDDRHYDRDSHETEAGRSIPVHYFHVEGYTVWGATASLLVQYLAATTDFAPP